jgi:hypothetical protein
MNKEIESIVNVTTVAVLDATGQWTYNSGAIADADEVVIRQITGNSTLAFKTIYLIKSSLNNYNGFIGCVGNIPGFVSNPGTRIQLRTPVGNSINFQVFIPTDPPAPTTGAATAMVAINMDFIKYRK